MNIGLCAIEKKESITFCGFNKWVKSIRSIVRQILDYYIEHFP